MIPRIDFCSTENFEEVKSKIEEFELDNRALKAEEFLVIKNREGLLGFGRIREFENFAEMCSLGIIESKRFSGLGKQLTQSLIEKTNQTIYLVCIIPEYFKNFGFNICESFPIEIQDKLNYCTQSLVVPEPYVVMRRN
jgi:N-acetylglutamate synthase-like GNAT family acetyltransferase